MGQPLLFFDLETVEDQDRAALWQQEKEEVEAKEGDFKAALSPECCRIISLAWAIDDGPVESAVVGLPRARAGGAGTVIVTEQLILRKFWQLVAPKPGPHPVVVGFNILNFDLPVIFIRSALLGICSTRLIDRRGWGPDCIDLYEVRRYASGGGKLKKLAHYLGLNVPTPDIEGSMVAEVYSRDPCRLEQYAKSDVEVTRELYHFYKGYFVRDCAAG